MSTDTDLAATIRRERERRGWSLDALAAHAGVSKSMISRLERAEASPTAALLGRLSGAFGLTLSQFFRRVETSGERLIRAERQHRWQDPASGYQRRQISPPASEDLELIEVELPAGADVPFPAQSYAFIRQLIWVLSGELVFVEGDVRHAMRAGDCLLLGEPAPCRFINPSGAPCRYVVAVARR
jgi:transcriptional regulator with XRE-family HTH domain